MNETANDCFSDFMTQNFSEPLNELGIRALYVLDFVIGILK